MKKDTIYVIGHLNPDLDSIASAIGYAWLLCERDGISAQAARTGFVNPQTSWVLERLELEPPEVVTDVSPRFESVARRLDAVTPDTLLHKAWDIASRTGGVAPIVNEDGTPYGLITGLSLFSFLAELVGPHLQRQEMKISEILDTPCREIADIGVPKFKAGIRIRDAINKILREERSYFFVLDEEGRYIGICRQRNLLNPPRAKIILVDHNEIEQSVASLEEAELIEVIDHHRLGNQNTRSPIRFTIDVVGSTSTLISERVVEAGLSAPPKIAGVLLSGLISDTLMLTSPTTTERDRRAADRLSRWAFAWDSPLKGETFETYAEEVLKAGAGLSTRDPEEIVSTDLKTYTAGNVEFAIAQAEVTNLRQVNKHLESLMVALENLRISKGLEFTMLMVTDVVQGSSRLIIANPPHSFGDIPYRSQPDGTYFAKGVVSRKKQLLPVILSILEGEV